MTLTKLHTRARGSIPAHAIWLVPLALPLLPIVACAVSNEETRPNDDIPNLVPGPVSTSDASDDASLVDGAPDAAVLTVPCSVGTICRVASPLRIGAAVAIAGRAKNDVWASGSRGLVLHWNGQQWDDVSAVPSSYESLTNLFVTPTETWGTSGPAVVSRDVDPSTIVRTRFTISRYFSGISVLPTGDIYACVSPNAAEGAVNQILGKVDIATKKYTFVADPVLPGSNQAQKMAVRAMHFVPDHAIWLVGDHGAVARYDVSPVGNGIIVPSPSTASLRAAWGYDEHLWASGSGGAILHYDGTAWQASPSGTMVTINAIFGFAPDDIWAAGERGKVLHFDGSSWSPVDVGGYDGTFRTIWGSGRDDVWFGGDNGLFHWGPLQ